MSTIQKQRQEIQLLVTELKDRDRELGDMMKSHEQQLMAWEQDRHRVISLDQKCSQYEGKGNCWPGNRIGIMSLVLTRRVLSMKVRVTAGLGTG